MPISPIKRFLPNSLLGRALLIIVSPLIIVQAVSTAIFFETHWKQVTRHLARGVAGDIATLVTLYQRLPVTERDWIVDLAQRNMRMALSFHPDGVLPETNRGQADGITDGHLSTAIGGYIVFPFAIDAETSERDVVITVQLPDGLLIAKTARNRLTSYTTYVFVLWSVGLSMLLFGVAVIFMRNQVKPVRRLAEAADAFGKGRDAPDFAPQGALEVRQAAQAFLLMRDRIQRQIGQRTDMLSGVSHDLRTPLTRMKLQLAMLGDAEGRKQLSEDVADMERMLEDYLAFARGEGSETPISADLTSLLESVVAQARRKGGAIDLHAEGEIALPLRYSAVKRCLTNLLDNAVRYAEHVFVRAGMRDGSVEVLIDDDGPGIPESQRADALKPFVRLESSRNPKTGGSGLGLSIALDVARAHGGAIALEDSPQGGLRVRLHFPL